MFTLCCQHYCQQHDDNLIHVTPCLHFVVSITASSTIAVWYTSHHVYTLLSALLPAAWWQSDTHHTMFTLCCQHYCQQHDGNLMHVTPCLHFVVSITASNTIALWYTSHHVYTLLSALLPATRWQSDTRHTKFTLCCQHYCQQHGDNLIHVTPCLHCVVSITASSTVIIWYTSHHVYTLLSALLPATR